MIYWYSNFKDIAFTEVKATRYVNGAPLSKGGNTKRVPFLAKMVYKMLRVGPWGGAYPYKTFPQEGSALFAILHALDFSSLFLSHSD